MKSMIAEKKNRIREIKDQMLGLQTELTDLETDVQEAETFLNRIPEYDTESEFFYVLRRRLEHDDHGDDIWEVVKIHHEKWVISDYVNFMAKPGEVFEISEIKRYSEGSGVVAGLKHIEC